MTIPRKKNTQIRAEKAHNTTLHKLCEEKDKKRKFTNSSQKSSLHYPKKTMTREKMHKFQPKKHLTLP